MENELQHYKYCSFYAGDKNNCNFFKSYATMYLPPKATTLLYVALNWILSSVNRKA